MFVNEYIEIRIMPAYCEASLRQSCGSATWYPGMLLTAPTTCRMLLSLCSRVPSGLLNRAPAGMEEFPGANTGHRVATVVQSSITFQVRVTSGPAPVVVELA